MAAVTILFAAFSLHFPTTPPQTIALRNDWDIFCSVTGTAHANRMFGFGRQSKCGMRGLFENL
jgi:hypothetical protein